MDFQNISFQLIRDKRIGETLFIVEGEKTEKRYLKHIFRRILGYELINQRNRRGYEFTEYQSPSSNHSKVYIAFARESNINQIQSVDQYLNDLFTVLIDRFGFNTANAAIYYIWDRDRNSNTNPELIRSLFQDLRSSRNESPSYRQGLLLMSYPSVEAFLASQFVERLNGQYDFALGDDLKQYLHTLHLTNCSHMTEVTLKLATDYFKNELLSYGIDSINLDDMSIANTEVFNVQEQRFMNLGTHRLLSMLVIALLDLGIIEGIEMQQMTR